MSHCCKYIINYTKASIPPPSTAIEATNNNHLSHNYSFDSAKTNGQQRIAAPQTNISNNKDERSLSPRK
jgi:hypothetical protein